MYPCALLAQAGATFRPAQRPCPHTTSPRPSIERQGGVGAMGPAAPEREGRPHAPVLTSHGDDANRPGAEPIKCAGRAEGRALWP